MKVFILAAGMGSRLSPLTDTIPKAMVPVAGKPMILHLLERLSNHGINEFVVNLHHHGDLLQHYLETLRIPGIRLYYSDERDALLDTGGALKRAATFFSDGRPFLVHNVDVWTDLAPSDLFFHHQKESAIATLAVRQRPSDRQFLFNSGMYLAGWEHLLSGKKTVVRKGNEPFLPLAFSGVQVVDPALFGYFPDAARFSLVELYLRAAEAEKITCFKHDEGIWADLGSIEKITRVESLMQT
jgi:NDP-sugar pyrophosphorylase family protein